MLLYNVLTCLDHVSGIKRYDVVQMDESPSKRSSPAKEHDDRDDERKRREVSARDVTKR